MTDPTNPEHYKQHPTGIEAIQITEYMSFTLGNAMKYIWRADHKNNPTEDLKKAVWYINREIQKRENQCKESLERSSSPSPHPASSSTQTAGPTTTQKPN